MARKLTLRDALMCDGGACLTSLDALRLWRGATHGWGGFFGVWCWRFFGISFFAPFLLLFHCFFKFPKNSPKILSQFLFPHFGSIFTACKLNQTKTPHLRGSVRWLWQRIACGIQHTVQTYTRTMLMVLHAFEFILRRIQLFWVVDARLIHLDIDLSLSHIFTMWYSIHRSVSQLVSYRHMSNTRNVETS